MTGAGGQKGITVETETNTQTVTLHDSLILPDAVVIGRRDHRGKVIAGDIFTREELQAIVQQAFDKYDVAPDPFASPGSMDLDLSDEAISLAISEGRL